MGGVTYTCVYLAYFPRVNFPLLHCARCRSIQHASFKHATWDQAFGIDFYRNLPFGCGSATATCYSVVVVTRVYLSRDQACGIHCNCNLLFGCSSATQLQPAFGCGCDPGLPILGRPFLTLRQLTSAAACRMPASFAGIVTGGCVVT